MTWGQICSEIQPRFDFLKQLIQLVVINKEEKETSTGTGFTFNLTVRSYEIISQMCLKAINLGYCNASETRSPDVFDFLPNTKVSFTVWLVRLQGGQALFQLQVMLAQPKRRACSPAHIYFSRPLTKCTRCSDGLLGNRRHCCHWSQGFSYAVVRCSIIPFTSLMRTINRAGLLTRKSKGGCHGVPDAFLRCEADSMLDCYYCLHHCSTLTLHMAAAWVYFSAPVRKDWCSYAKLLTSWIQDTNRKSHQHHRLQLL